MTYWPLTDRQAANEPAGSRGANAERSNASEANLRAAKPDQSYQAQPTGRQQRTMQEKPLRQPTQPGPLTTPPAPAARTGGYLAIVSRRGARLVPTDSGMQRRRLMITTSKFALPAAAVLLLSLIALWPELHVETDRARFSMSGVSVGMDGARLTNAHYNGVDERGRPYTVTAATAVQRDADRVDLTVPNADITLENGTWLNVKSKQGVYMRKDQQLDLSNDVMLYRDDGTTLTTAAATVALKDGAASSQKPTHVEGPFGKLDATGFTTVDKGAALQFWGPVRVDLNGVSK
jgi:lipopolysaccharide export system protein LptC